MRAAAPLALLPFLLCSCGNAVSGAGAVSGTASLEAKVDELNATIRAMDVLNKQLICYLAVQRACGSTQSCIDQGDAACDKASK